MPRKAQGAKAAYPAAGAKRKSARKPKASTKPKKAAKPEQPKPVMEQADVTEQGAVDAIVKRYRGRPTKYDPAFCEMVICWGRLGKSKAWMAAELMLNRETLDEWARVHPDFSDSLTVAKQLEQQWWEDAGQSNLGRIGFQSSAWSRSMAARFPKDWREQKQIDHGVTDALAALLSDIDGNGASLL